MSDVILGILGRKVDPSRIRHVGALKGGEYHSPCPVCGGTDRFHVWPNQDGGATAMRAGVPGTWWCRTCNETGDVIDLLKFMDGLEFAAACKELRIELSESGRRLRPLRQPRPAASVWKPTEWKIPPEKWREHATKLSLTAHEQLLAKDDVLKYLAWRGLPMAAVTRYRLGYLEGEDNKTGKWLYRARSAFDLPDKQNRDGTKTRQVLRIPRGITIPLLSPSWKDAQEVHRIRIRRRKEDLQGDDPKYLLLEGSGQAPMVLGPDGVAPELAVWVIVEAELDALAVHHACGGRVGVAAVLTNRGKPDAHAHAVFSKAPMLLVALDFDPPGTKGERPGYQGWLWWHEQYGHAKRWPVPTGKDPGEAKARGLNLASWVNAALPEALSFLPDGTVGVSVSGLDSQGERAQAPVPQNPPVSNPVPKRWAQAGADTPLLDAVFPDSFTASLASLRQYYAGKIFDDALLVVCPKPEHPWWWIAYKNCRNCKGHAHCLVDFLTSPQMLAPAGALESAHG